MLAKETLMKDAVRKQNEHLKEKPELQDGDTIETLDARIKEQEPKLIEFAEKKGAISQELKTDEENKKSRGKLIEEVEKRSAEYQKWSRMNQLIGDATGNTFRKIAQSYVLTSLIHSANSYMKTQWHQALSSSHSKMPIRAMSAELPVRFPVAKVSSCHYHWL